MLMPTILSNELKHYGDECKDGNELLQALLKTPQDLIPFVEYAVADETWSEKFQDFTKEAVKKLTILFITEKMSFADSQRVLHAIREHYAVLEPFILQDVIFFIGFKNIKANSMLYGASSEFFHDLLRREYLYKKNKNIPLRDISYDNLVMIDEFIKTGKIKNLWRKDQNVILEVLQMATIWEIHDLVSLSEEQLRLYITLGNVFEMLTQTQLNSWPILRKSCIDFINKQNLGIRMEDKGPGFLGFEFLEFKEREMELFDKIKDWITHLIVSLRLTEDPGFTKVLKMCPKLVGVDLSRSLTFSERLLEIPADLRELDISKCEWLSTRTMKKLFQICPHVEKLTMNSNVQINYQGWAILRNLKGLKTLDISRCHQVNDEDFKVILQACKGVTTLSLGELKKLTDKAFYELSKAVPRLAFLNVARCEISDSMLIEMAMHCRSLISLNVTRCPQISEVGVVEAVRHSPHLRELNITHCPIPDDSIKEMKKLNPYLKIIKD